MNIIRSTVAGHDAFTVAAGRLAVTCVPARGAHLTSLRQQDHEWLFIPPGGPRLAPVAAHGSFLPHQEGADDCFPAVGRDMVRGVRHHDHGEVWHHPWRIIEAVDRLRLRIDLPVSGLRCERSIAADGDGLRFDWLVSNPKEHPVPYLWCWHPLFAWHPGDCLELPGVKHVMQRTRSGTAQLDWPIAWPGADLSVGLLGEQLCSKSFIRSTGLAMVRSGTAGLAIRWDPLVLPWAGLWIKHDDGMDQWAIEPTTVNSDWLSTLPAIPPESILPAHGERSWSIRLQPC